MPRWPFSLSMIVALGLVVAAPAAADEGTMCVENATIADLQQALTDRRTSAAELVRAYLARIEAYDRGGPRVNAVRETNPDALAIAAAASPAATATADPELDPPGGTIGTSRSSSSVA